MQLSKYLSVVIPAYNEENYIGGLLKDLTTQIYAEDVAVYVADGGSTDKTVEICKSYMDRLNLKVIKGGTVTQGRNAGLRETKTECVVFIDADVRLSNPFQLFSVWYELGDHHLVGCKLRSSGSVESDIAHMVFNFANYLLSKWRPFAVGAFSGFRTYRLRKLGGWDETLIHGEDWILSGKYGPRDFAFCPYHALVDDRRLKKTGYFGMLRLMLVSAWKGEEYMRRDHGYWK